MKFKNVILILVHLISVLFEFIGGTDIIYPFLLSDEGIYRRTHIYYVFESIRMFLLSLLISNKCKDDLINKVFIYIVALDFVDYWITFNEPWLNIHISTLVIPISYNVVSFIVLLYFIYQYDVKYERGRF